MAYVNIDERYVMRFEVEPNQVDIIPFEYQKKDKKTGELLYKDGEPVKATMYSQKMYIYLGKQIIECKVGLKEGQPPYPAGMYVLELSSSVKVDGFGSVEFGFDTILVPYSEAKGK
ncbi:heavy metal transporter [Salmonella enterica]|nr:heavy metal transporter [Salmonella enterica]